MATILEYIAGSNSLSVTENGVTANVAGTGIDNAFTAPQTFDSTINQSPGAGASNQGPFLQAADAVQDYIVSGINPGVPSPASLTMTIPAGTAFVLGQRTILQAAVADTYPASSDTYFSMTNTGQVAYTSVANGAAAPAAPANSVNLLKVTTGPIIAPTPAVLASTAAGTLAIGSYAYQIVERDATGYGLPGVATTITTTATGEIILSWTPSLNAVSADVYGRSGTLGLLASGITTGTWTDDGSITPGAAAPTVATSNAIQSITPLVDVGVNAALHGSVIGDHVAEGMLIPVPLPASLTASLNPGQAWVGGSFIELDTAIANTYAANSDTYVYLDATGNLIYQAVGNGQLPMVPPGGVMPLARVEAYPATPPVVVAVPTTGTGTLPAGTYGYAAVRHDATGYSLIGVTVDAVLSATGETVVHWTPAINETSIDIYRTAAGGSVLGLLVSGATGGVYTDTGSVTPGAAPATTATSNAIQRVKSLAPIYPDAASADIGHWNPDGAVMIWIGDSTTEQMGDDNYGYGSGFNFLNEIWRAPGSPLESMLGLINFGSSGNPFFGFVGGGLTPGWGPSGPLPGPREAAFTWDYWGHKPIGSVSLSTSIYQRNTLPGNVTQVIWVLCYGINDVLLYNSQGLMTPENIADYIEMYIDITVKKILANNPSDFVILRMPNTMTSRPFTSGQGFPNQGAYPNYGLNDTIDAALVNNWNLGLAQGYLQAQGKHPRTIMVDLRPYFGYSSTEFTSIPQGVQTSSATIDVNMRLGNMVHPSTSIGQPAITNYICHEAIRYTDTKNMPVIDNKVVASQYINYGYSGNAFDIDPFYLDGNHLYSEVMTSSVEGIGSSFIRLKLLYSSALLNPNILHGRNLYIRFGGTNKTSITIHAGTYNTPSLSGTNTQFSGLTIPANVVSGGFTTATLFTDFLSPSVDLDYANSAYILSGARGGNIYAPATSGAVSLALSQTGLIISNINATGVIYYKLPASPAVGTNFTFVKGDNVFVPTFYSTNSIWEVYNTVTGVNEGTSNIVVTDGQVIWDGTYWNYTPAESKPQIAVSSTTTAGAITATAAQLAGQYLADGATQTAAFTITTDTAVNILAAMPNAIVGTAFKWRFINNDQSATGYAGTLAGGTGVTIGTILPNPAVPKGGLMDYVFTFTAIGSVPTVTVEAVGGSSAALL